MKKPASNPALIAIIPAVMILVQQMMTVRHVPDVVVGLFMGFCIGVTFLWLIAAMRAQYRSTPDQSAGD